jgi:predicted acyl esterase
MVRDVFLGHVENVLRIHDSGRNQQESVLGMIAQYPFMNEYWEDKRARIEDIEVPAYVLASYSTGLHTLGSFRGFEDIKHKKKWYDNCLEVWLT